MYNFFSPYLFRVEASPKKQAQEKEQDQQANSTNIQEQGNKEGNGQ